MQREFSQIASNYLRLDQQDRVKFVVDILLNNRKEQEKNNNQSQLSKEFANQFRKTIFSIFNIPEDQKRQQVNASRTSFEILRGFSSAKHNSAKKQSPKNKNIRISILISHLIGKKSDPASFESDLISLRRKLTFESLVRNKKNESDFIFEDEQCSKKKIKTKQKLKKIVSRQDEEEGKSRENESSDQQQDQHQETVEEEEENNKETSKKKGFSAESQSNNLIALLLISQLLGGYTGAASVFSKPLMEKYGYDRLSLSSIPSVSFYSQALGFFVGQRICNRIGVKNGAGLGSMLLGLGCVLSSLSLALLQGRLQNSILPFMFSYGVIGALGNGILESSAFVNIRESFSERSRLVAALFIAMTSLAPFWMCPLSELLVSKFGIPLAISTLSLGAISFLPMLKLISVNDVLGQNKSSRGMYHSFLPAREIVSKLRPSMLAHAYLLLVQFASKTVMHADCALILQDLLGVGPRRAAIITGTTAIFASLGRLLFLGYLIQHTSPTLSISTMLCLQIASLAGMMYVRKSPTLFAILLSVFTTAVAFAFPLTRRQSLSSFASGTSIVEKRTFSELQSYLTMLGGLFPLLTAYLNEGDRSSSSQTNTKAERQHNWTFYLLLMLDLSALAFFWATTSFEGKPASSSSPTTMSSL